MPEPIQQPEEEKGVPEPQPPTEEEKIEALYVQEMGFASIVELLIKYQKPLIGHNLMFDMVFLFRQCIGDLPEKFSGFVRELGS